MHIKKTEVIDEEYFKTMFDIMNEKKLDLNGWKRAKFCKHDEEPLVMMRLPDNHDEHGIMPEHVAIIQPACNKYIKSKDDMCKKTTEYQVRVAFLKSPGNFWMDFYNQCYKRPTKEKYENIAV